MGILLIITAYLLFSYFMKKFLQLSAFTTFIFCVLIFMGAGCGRNDKGAVLDDNGIGNRGEIEIRDMCGQFSAEIIEEASGKQIVKTELKNNGAYCQYFTEYSDDYYKLPNNKVSPGGLYFSLNYENLSIENQKKSHEFLDRTITTDPKIPMEHFLVIQEDGIINEVYLVIDENHFFSINRSSNKVLSEEEIINFAVKIAGIIKKGIPKVSQSANQIEVVRKFFDYLSEKNVDEALKMMDANADTKQGWGVNFNTIQALKIKNMEPVYEEEWTSVRQVFKADLEIKSTDAGEQYGWNQGINMRWVTVEKNGDTWLIHELANNP